MTQKKIPLINSAHGSETRNIINELIKLFNQMGYTYDEALNKAHDVLNEAQQTNDMNVDVQQQINTMIVESGTSDAEVLQARIDSEGNEYDVLKTRLDEKEQNFSAQLADKANLSELLEKNPIYVADYGVHYSKKAEENTPLFKQALADAELYDKPVILPWCPIDAFIEINDDLITTKAVTIIGYGRHTRIKQVNFPKGIFLLKGIGSTVRSFDVFGIDFDATGMGADHVSHYGVRSRASHCVIDDIQGDWISTVVRVGGGENNEQNVGTSVTNVKSGENVVFNLLASNTKDLKYDNITGSYRYMTGVGTPPHLIYVDNSVGYDNYNMRGGYCYAKNGTGSYAYQFKGMRGGNAGILTAENCYGSYHVMDSSDFHCDEVVSINDTYNKVNSGQGSFSFDSMVENKNLTVDRVKITMTTTGHAMFLDKKTKNSVIKNVDITANHDVILTSGQPELYDVHIDGENNKLIDISVKNIGVNRFDAGIGIMNGKNHVIDNPITHGNTYGIKTYSYTSSDGHIIKNYVPEKQTGNRYGGLNIFTDNTKVNPEENSKVLVSYDRAFSTNSQYATTSYTSSGHLWVTPTEALRVSNQRLYTGGMALAFIDTGTPNIAIKTGIKYFTASGLVLRAVDKDNYIAIISSSGTSSVFINSYIDGVSTRLAEASFSFQTGRRYEFKGVAFDNLIEFFIDDKFICSATLDSSLMTTFGNVTNHGIRSSGNVAGLFDNIEWLSVE